MKFICTVDIDVPIEQVVELYDNTDNFRKWQDGFISITPIGGTPGKAGAKSKVLYKTGKRDIELIETIIAKNLPQEFSAMYEHKHMVNVMNNSFISRGVNKTTFESEIVYTKFIGFLPKMMALLMPGVFRKQTQKWLDQFKAFAEQEGKNG